ncbi:MAG: hypothetical protein IKD20_04220 [Clostridia bacterium]|nr:hypothetical protein [Clostridia bacterium]
MAVEYRTYQAPSVNEKEVLRYFGAKGHDAESKVLFASVRDECAGVFSYKVAYAQVELDELREMVGVRSETLESYIDGCRAAVIFAATAGFGIDRLISKYSRLSPIRALMLQAYGAERVESLCDRMQADVEREFGAIRPRISAGYGDLPLDMQRAFVRRLDLGRRLGITLNESLLMSPSKSVTGIIGLQ